MNLTWVRKDFDTGHKKFKTLKKKKFNKSYFIKMNAFALSKMLIRK